MFYLRNCLYFCFLNQVETECKCSFWNILDFKGKNLRKCITTEETKCIDEKYHEIFQNKKEHCMCPLECNKMTYSFTTSSTDFPTVAYGKKLLKNSFISKKYPNMTLDELERRLISLNVYYPKLSYSFISEQQQYTITDLISSIGGSLGLLLGASLLSLMEIIDLFVRILMIFFRKNRNGSSPLNF